MLDKYKSCIDLETGEDCPDRIVGCHDTCEGYLTRCKQRDEIRKNRDKDRDIRAYEFERSRRYAIRRERKKYKRRQYLK